MSVARSSAHAVRGEELDPESAWTALRVEATRATVLQLGQAALAAVVDSFTMVTSTRRKLQS